MSRTREDILEDIEFFSEWAEEDTKRAEVFKQELKAFDEKEKSGE